MIPSRIKILLLVTTLVTVWVVNADTLDPPSSKVMVRGCKAMLFQKQDADTLLPQDKEIGLAEQSCKIDEEIHLLDAIIAQRKKEGERQRLKFLGLKRSSEGE